MLRGEVVQKSRWAESLTSRASTPSPPDGFVFELRGAALGDTVDAFARTVCRVLHTVASHDPDLYFKGTSGWVRRQSCVEGDNESFNHPRWHFRFMGESYFVTTFAPCYPETHSRFMFAEPDVNEDSCFVLLQPELGFLLRNLSPDTPATNWDHPVTERDQIRVAYRDHGRSYYIPPVVAYPAAHYIVASLENEGQNVVRWWEHRARRE